MHHENNNLLNEVSKSWKMVIDGINILFTNIKKEDRRKERKEEI